MPCVRRPERGQFGQFHEAGQDTLVGGDSSRKGRETQQQLQLEAIAGRGPPAAREIDRAARVEGFSGGGGTGMSESKHVDRVFSGGAGGAVRAVRPRRGTSPLVCGLPQACAARVTRSHLVYALGTGSSLPLRQACTQE